MKQHKIKIGVVSNNKKKRLEKIFKETDVDFVSKAHKPSPLGIKYLMCELRLQPGHTIYVGDKKKDIIAAHCAGIKSVKVKTMKKGETT